MTTSKKNLLNALGLGSGTGVVTQRQAARATKRQARSKKNLLKARSNKKMMRKQGKTSLPRFNPAGGAEAGFPVTPANIHEFLRHMLVDSEAGGRVEGDKAPPGFVTWMPMRMDPEDYHVVEWAGGDPLPPFTLPAGDHGAAYAVAMTALLYLRRWWYESEDFLGGDVEGGLQTGEEALNHMAEDLGVVISMLTDFQTELTTLAPTLHGDLEAAAAELKASQEAASRYGVKADEAARSLAELELKQVLRDKLTQGPMELLAGGVQAEDDSTQNEE